MPRCGGTSFTAWLRSQYAAAGTLTLEGRGNAERVAEFAARSETERHAIQLVVGHAARDVLHLVRPDILRITCFRDPIERVESFYRYVLAEPGHLHHDFVVRERTSLEVFVQDVRIPGARNYFTYQLSRLPREEITRDPSGAVDAAFAFLGREFDLVGSLARLDAFCAAVTQAAQFDRKPLAPANESLLARTLRRFRFRANPTEHAAKSPHAAIARLNATDASGKPQLNAHTAQALRAANEADILFFQRLETMTGSTLAGGRCQVV